MAFSRAKYLCSCNHLALRSSFSDVTVGTQAFFLFVFSHFSVFLFSIFLLFQEDILKTTPNEISLGFTLTQSASVFGKEMEPFTLAASPPGLTHARHSASPRGAISLYFFPPRTFLSSVAFVEFCLCYCLLPHYWFGSDTFHFYL